MLWPLDCFVARAPRNDGWVAADPIDSVVIGRRLCSDYDDSAFYRVTINYFDARSTKTNLPRGGPAEAARVQRQIAKGGIGNLGKPPHGKMTGISFQKTKYLIGSKFSRSGPLLHHECAFHRAAT
jgi:hypothetical protein